MPPSTRLYQEVQNNSEALVMAHLGMVKRVALHLKVRLPPFMEVDELIQVGMIGLLEAARAYDASKGIEFENFAHSRVRGAILDEVRRMSFLPRSAVAINKSHNEATHSLAAELGRTPTQAELAEHMGKDIDDFHKERTQANRFDEAEALFQKALVNNPGEWGAKYQYDVLRHAEWHGCTPTDLVFPFFLFIVGVSIALGVVPRARLCPSEPTSSCPSLRRGPPSRVTMRPLSSE